jgi:hypothetical protein
MKKPYNQIIYADLSYRFYEQLPSKSVLPMMNMADSLSASLRHMMNLRDKPKKRSIELLKAANPLRIILSLVIIISLLSDLLAFRQELYFLAPPSAVDTALINIAGQQNNVDICRQEIIIK